MMRRSSWMPAVTALSMGVAAHSASAQIAVNESAYGEFSDSLSTRTMISPDLAIGINTITGRANLTDPMADVDVFGLTLPSGLMIAAIGLSVSNWVPATSGNPGSFELIDAPANTGIEYFSANGTIPLSFSITNPSTIGVRISAPIDGPGFSGGNPPGSFDYVLSVTVSQIPTPTAAALLGLGGLTTLRRRRR